MEYGLGLAEATTSNMEAGGLNPCFNGIWSRTGDSRVHSYHGRVVLILVLMEYGLGPAPDGTRGSMSRLS